MSLTRRKTKRYNVSYETSIVSNDLLSEGIFRSVDNNIHYANSAFIKLFGYSTLDELSTVQLTTLFVDEEARAYVLDKIEAKGRIARQRVLFKTKMDKKFWGSLTIRRMLCKGEFILEGSVLNITDYLNAEEQLKMKSQELEKLSMELDRFIYSASHDIRSPVSTLMGVINLIKLDLKDDTLKTYVGMMEESLDRLDHIVRKLVEYAKNSKMAVGDNIIDFEDLVSKVLNDLKLIHPAYGRVTLTIEIQSKPKFYSDADRLQLILFNVIKNALDYSDANKTSQLLSIIIHTEPNKATIEIFDNGIGIPASHIDKVFKMFYRGTLLSKGSGIGLYTVRETVVKLGGFITLDSEYGIGTCVKIEVPNSKKGRLINKKSILKIHK